MKFTLPRPDKFAVPIKPSCGVCEDLRFISKPDGLSQVYGWCPECRPVTPGAKYWQAPMRYRDASIEAGIFSGNQKILVEKLKENPNGSYYISGSIATGKTHMAVCQAKIVDGLAHQVVWCNGYTLGELNRDRGITLEKGMHLFVDDIDKLYSTEYQASRVWGLLDQCYTDSIPVTITANMSMRDFCKLVDTKSSGKSMGASLLHRLDEMCDEVRFE